MMKRYRLPALAAFAITILSSALYIPFLGNALVFDDHNIFTNLSVYDHAQTLFNFHPRTFPYFTLGITQVLIGSIEAQRVVSLILHIFCALILFVLLAALLKQALQNLETNSGVNQKFVSTQANTLSFVGSVWFAIHPIAVYGAGYLTQRTILFATIFSLLSLWYYRRAIAENRTGNVIIAALFYAAAVFSKEHAVMLPAATILLTPLYGGTYRPHTKHIGLYLLLCIPAAITVILAAKSVVGTSYEPDAGKLMSFLGGIPFLDNHWGQWLISIVIQANLFLDYFFYWLVPDIQSISADMRIDFARIWTAWWFIPKVMIFVVSPFAALYLLHRRGLAALFAFGFLYSWLLYLTELAAVRFQEPFVLYRSYLWAPGFVLMVVAICGALPQRWVKIASVPVFAICFWFAHERLASLANDGTLWKDAAAKLKSDALLGSDRILYNRGMQHLKDKNFDNAVVDFSHVIFRFPNLFQAYYQRGSAYYSLGNYKKAQSDFYRALDINREYGPAHYAQGLVFEHFGCRSEAIHAYTLSHQFGVPAASLKIHDLTEKWRGGKQNQQKLDSASCVD